MTRVVPGDTKRQRIKLIRQLDPRRFLAHLACFDRLLIFGFARRSTLAQIFGFPRRCRRKRMAVVQTCGFYTNIFGLSGAAIAGGRIGSRRELNPGKSAGQLRLQTLSSRAAMKVVGNSQAAERILEQEGVATASIAVIPNGLDRATSREREPNRPIRTVITVGSLRPEENHAPLVAAAATVLTEAM